MDARAAPDTPRRSAGHAPPRRPGSVRRTSSIDVTWPDGRQGDMRLLGRARDAVTPRSGEGLVRLAEDSFEARLRTDRTILEIDAQPPRPALVGLVGERGGGGLRRALARAAPEEWRRATPLYLILDDMAGASLVASWAWSQWDPRWVAGIRERMSEPEVAAAMERRRGVCVGLAHLPSLVTIDAADVAAGPQGAPAPDLRRPDDPEGWHELPAQHGPGMRRARRIDIWLDDLIRIDAAFQDSATTPGGGRRAVHEYQVTVAADPATLEVLSVQADPRILPHVDCPAAVGNVWRLVGTRLPDLRETVLAELRGVAGCTHLNDALRALADAPALVERLRAAEAA